MFFVGVFQYDSGTQKHALELKKMVWFFFFLPLELNLYGLELKVQEVKYRVLNSFRWFFFHFFLFVSSVKSFLGRTASTAILKYGPFSQDSGLSSFFQSCPYSCIYDKYTQNPKSYVFPKIPECFWWKFYCRYIGPRLMHPMNPATRVIHPMVQYAASDRNAMGRS